MIDYKELSSFYQNKTVLITGHTGFKGTWLTRILQNFGANVIGVSDTDSFPLYKAVYGQSSSNDSSQIECQTESSPTSVFLDVVKYDELLSVFKTYHPDIVFHLAAQPIVTVGYNDPRATYETNVMGTVNVLECIRECIEDHVDIASARSQAVDSMSSKFPLLDTKDIFKEYMSDVRNNSNLVKSVVIVTTDKVYENHEWCYGYRENDVLNGYDPYSNSKSCSELATQTYVRSYDYLPPISTVRAGNVIGGGDLQNNRIIPDCVRAINWNRDIEVRNPYSIRPYQHVLEPLFAYLLIGYKQYENRSLAGSYNVGPDECDCVRTGELVKLFCEKWGKGAHWVDKSRNAVNGDTKTLHEANFLKLDCSLMKSTFGWHPKWHIDRSVNETVLFWKVWKDYTVKMLGKFDVFYEENDGIGLRGLAKAILEEMDREILEYIEG